MNYHLIGIGGVSMSGLAKLLVSYSHKVSGCDLKNLTSYSLPLTSYVGHSPDHITKDLDAVIVTAAAVHTDSPAQKELDRAKELGIKIITRSKLIGQLMNDKFGIAIAGMHGKTTTTTMIGEILEQAGYDPTVLVGSNVKKWKGNVRIPKIKDQRSKIKYFVVEACEYERQMLDFRPKIAVILNLEEEHLDTYPGGMPEIKKAFKKFIKLIPKNGLLVLNQDDRNIMSLMKSAQCKIKRFTAKKIWPGLNLRVLGKHNLLDATAAARVCHELGVKHEIIKSALNNFVGADRRFEIKGEKNGITVIDDYGHHPTEIKATIQTALEYKEESKNLILNPDKLNSKLIVVFQPHQYTRTKLLFKDFVKSFTGVDKLIISDIYLIAGREPKEARADFSKDLVSAIKKQNIDAEYVSDYAKIAQQLKKIARSGDVILTIGATDIYKVGEEFLK
jgi:UDP-N-acetylmuramate--alanine ligase